MRRTLILLGLLLVAQLGLALGLSLHDHGLEAFKGATPLLEVKASSSDQLVLTGADGAKLTLQKKNGDWTLPEHFAAPAAQKKIGDLLARLDKITRPWPVGKGDDLARRFKVADGQYERRLQFKQGDKVVSTLLLGSSPGFRKVHARVGGEATIYDIPLSTYEISLKAQDWIDQTLLQLEAKQVQSVTLPDCSLIRSGDKLQVDGLGAGEQTVAAKADKLLRALTDLRIVDAVATPDNLTQPALQLHLGLKDGKPRAYRFYGPKDGKGSNLLQVSGYSYLFKVGPQLQKELSGYTRAQLVETKPAPAKKADSTQATTLPVKAG